MSRPVVLSTSPVNTATDVARNTYITAIFDQAMDPATISSLTFVVYKEDGSYIDVVGGGVSYLASTRTARFTPTSLLDASSSFRATIFGSSVTNIFGEAMLANQSWSFSTASTIPEPTGTPDVPDDEEEDEDDTTLDPLAVLAVSPGNILWGESWGIEQDATVEITFSDDLWVESPADATGVLPGGAIDDPAAWLAASITVTATPVLGEEAGFTPNTPTFTVDYDEATNIVTLTPTSLGKLSSSYTGWAISYSEQAGYWEPDCDYVVTVKKDRLVGLATSVMEDDFVFYFTTKLIPMYSSVQTIRLLIGAIGNSIPDATIAAIIHRNSIRVTTMTSVSTPPSDEVRQYVACKTALDILSASLLGVGLVGSGRRTLGDMTISKDSGGATAIVGPLMERLVACVATNELSMTGGDSAMDWVVPHSTDERFPGTDSTWRRLNKQDASALIKPGTSVRTGANTTYPFIRGNI